MPSSNLCSAKHAASSNNKLLYVSIAVPVTIGMAASANIAQMMSMAAPNYDDSTMQALGVFSLAAEGSFSACLSKGDELNWEKVRSLMQELPQCPALAHLNLSYKVKRLELKEQRGLQEGGPGAPEAVPQRFLTLASHLS